MRPVLDAAALVALVAGEPGAVLVDQHLRQGDAAMSAVNYAEALDGLLRRSADPQAIQRIIGDLAREPLDVVPVDLATAEAAAVLRARHYSARRRPVSLADCVCAATARSLDGTLVSTDQELLALCADEGIPTVALPR
jgi:predicted nucleic acid-binding protein